MPLRILKPSWAHETLDYSEPPAPPDETLLPTFKGRRHKVTRTTRGLGAGAKRVSGDPSSRVEERWMALLKQGLFDLDTVPELLGRSEGESGYARCDEIESYVVKGVESGATIRALTGGGAHAADDVLRAVARLAHRELLRLG